MSTPYVANPGPERAPEGTNPSTAHFWLVIACYGLSMVPAFIYIATLDFGPIMAASLDRSNPFAVYGFMFTPAYLAVLAISFAIFAATAVLAYFDYRELAARGIQRPFHWATALVPSYGTWIYVIGRSVVVHRRTRGGLAPLWVFIAITVLGFIAMIAASIVMMMSMIGQMNDLYPTPR